MLLTLRIKNYAVIEEAEIHFSSGLNVISGETGAGKSIIIGAIQLLLGQRAQGDAIRENSPEAVIEGLFDITGLPFMQERIQQLALDNETEASGESKITKSLPTEAEHLLLIRRIIHRTGRHRIYINGNLATLAMLETLCDGLVDLCGQSENQTLLKPSARTELLDRFAGSEDLKDLFEEKRRAFTEKLHQIQEHKQKYLGTRELDFLEFQLKELRSIDMKPGEDEALLKQKQLLQSGQQRYTTVHSILSQLNGNSESESSNDFSATRSVGAFEILASAHQKLKTLTVQDETLVALVGDLNTILVELETLIENLQDYESKINWDSLALEQTLERISQLSEVKRKYGGSLTSALLELETIENKIRNFQLSSKIQEELEAAAQELESNAKIALVRLQEKRQSSAKLFSKKVTKELHELGMEAAQFVAHFPDPSEKANPFEMIHCEFQLQTNLGDSAKPIQKIASGGELSRVLLAIRNTCSGRGPTGVYLFDEIDAGIGGRTAYAVGSKLGRVASNHQVICITHLAQVAAFADHHLCVKKQTRNGKTYTRVEMVDGKDRHQEMARMIGASENSTKGLRAVIELIEEANRGKQKSSRSRSH